MPDDAAVRDVLQAGEAIAAPGRPGLTYGGLRAQVERTVATLNRPGIGRQDRVAIVLPNGPEMANAFVAVAAGATTVPLNPADQADEFDFYLRDLQARAVPVARGPHLAATQANGVKLLTDGEERVAQPRCTSNPAKLGPQDYVFITHNPPSVLPVVDKMLPLLGLDTAVVTTVNGIPWWYL